MLNPAMVDNANLSARLAVLRESVKDFNHDEMLIQSFYDICLEIEGLLFDRISKKYRTVENVGVTALTDFLVSSESILSAIESGDRSHRFTSQRRMFRLYFLMFCHPQYEERFGWWARTSEDMATLSVADHIYAVAERQNRNPSASGNLYAEGEWLNQFNCRYGDEVGLVNIAGVEAALSLWRNLVYASSSRYPNVLVRLFQNLRESCLFHEVRTWRGDVYGREAWVEKWRQDYLSLDKGLEYFEERQDAVSSLVGDAYFPKWKRYAKLARAHPIEIYDSPKIQDLYEECLEYEGEKCLFYMWSCLARHQRWGELEQIWFDTQPRETQAHWVGNKLLTRSIPALSRFICEASSWEMSLGDRVECLPYFSRSVSFVLYLIYRDERLDELSFKGSSIADCRNALKAANSVVNRLHVLLSKPVVSHLDEPKKKVAKGKAELVKKLESLKNLLESDLKSKLLHCLPDVDKYDEDRETIREMWRKTNEVFQDALGHLATYRIETTRDIGSLCEVTVPGDSSYRYTKRSGEFIHGNFFDGQELARQLVFSVANDILRQAKEFEMDPSPGITWLLPIEMRSLYPKRADKLVEEKSGVTPAKSDRYLWLDTSHKIIAVGPDSITVEIHEWPDYLYFNGQDRKHRAMVYGALDWSEKLSSWLCCHYGVVVNDPAGIAVFGRSG